MERKHTVFLTIIAVATLLVAVVGATFAYFSVGVSGTGTTASSQVVFKTANVGITYDTGTELVLGADSAGVVPGANGTLTFTVVNTGEVEMTYAINWESIVNTFSTSHPEELIYSLTSTGTGAATVANTNMPLNGTTPTIASNIAIAAGATHSYTLRAEFVETSSEQNYNQGKMFSGKIGVVVNAVSASS